MPFNKNIQIKRPVTPEPLIKNTANLQISGLKFMYSTSPQIRSLDNRFIRPVKLEEVDEDHKP